MTQISVTRALTEIKHLSDRINRSTGEAFIGLARGRDAKKVCVNSPSSTVDAAAQTLTGNLQSVLDLINRRDQLKRAVVKSNAQTTVSIAGETMTVAEAIEKKASIGFKTTLLHNLRNQYVHAKNKVEAENTKLLQEINIAVQAAYGNEKGKVDDSQYQAVANPRLAISEFSLIDPNKIEETIKKLDEELSNFMTEIDFTLSESNSRTNIEV